MVVMPFNKETELNKRKGKKKKTRKVYLTRTRVFLEP